MDVLISHQTLDILEKYNKKNQTDKIRYSLQKKEGCQR